MQRRQEPHNGVPNYRRNAGDVSGQLFKSQNAHKTNAKLQVKTNK